MAPVPPAPSTGVRDNIEKFGSDPGRVLIFGQSSRMPKSRWVKFREMILRLGKVRTQPAASC